MALSAEFLSAFSPIAISPAPLPTPAHLPVYTQPLPTRRPTRLFLAILLFIAALLRLLPVGYGLPEPGYFSSDEIDAVSRALKIGAGDLMPLHFNKPTLYNVVLAGGYGVEYVLLRLTRGDTLHDFERLFFLNPTSFYLLARTVNALASLATLLLLFALLRRAPRSAQITAFLILAFGRSSVFYAHVAKEDPLAQLFTFAAFAAALLATRRSRDPLTPPAGRLRRLVSKPQTLVILSAAAAGLAVSSKYNVFFAPLFPAIALWQLPLTPGQRLRTAAAALLAMIVAFGLGTPYAILHPVQFVTSTLQSTVAAQVAGDFQILGYAENRGLAFLIQALWREFGLSLIALFLAFPLFFRRRGTGERRLLLPVLLYALVLAVSSQLDYQYILPLTPFAAWTVGQALASSIADSSARWPRRAIILSVAAGALLNSYFLVRQSAEYLGGDTRQLAAPTVERLWRETGPNPRPLLILSGFYFHYYPALHFDPSTYERLLDEARAQGAEGGYFKRAADYARQDNRPLVSADFLQIRTGFRRLPDGTREFEPQTFPLNLDAYRGRYSYIIIPENTLRILTQPAPELQNLRNFLHQIQALPERSRLTPTPWRTSGPALFVYQAP